MSEPNFSTSPPLDILLWTTNKNLMVALQEKSGDRQIYRVFLSGNHEYQYKSFMVIF